MASESSLATTASPDLGRRVFAACFFVPVVLAALWIKGWVLLVFVLVVCGRGAWEFFYLTSAAGYRAPCKIGVGLSLAIPAWIFATGSEQLYVAVAVAILAALVASLTGGTERFTANAAIVLAGTLYVGLLGSGPLLLSSYLERTDMPVERFLVAVMLCVWLADTGAYGFGYLWGQRRLAPSISPGKTVAGLVGGITCGLLPTLGYAFFRPLTAEQVAGFFLIVALGGQLGDLVESAIKRDLGFKDAPILIPGHGGMLDRFDSYLFAFPLAYIYLQVVSFMKP